MIVACGQMVAHELADAESVWPVVERLAEQAAAARADLLVLPECTYPAYWLVSRAHFGQQQLLDQQEVLSRFGNIARSGGFWLVVGFVEQTGGRLYNSAAVIDRAGEVIGIARKSFLWDCDNRWFSPGEQISVFDTEFGAMGVMICADGRAPEITATLASQGAQMVIMPTAWVNAAIGTGRFENPQADFLIKARASEFNLPFVCADKSGREGGVMEYVGQSRIVEAGGKTMARAPIDGEHLLIGELTPQRTLPVFLSPKEMEILLRSTEARPVVLGSSLMLEIEASMQPADVEAAAVRAGANVARVAFAGLYSFQKARCAALQGAQLIVAEDFERTFLFSRTRAMENRVFVVTGGHKGVSGIVGPTGRVLWRRSQKSKSPALNVNLAQADDKWVTPETNIWAQRRVGSFRLRLPPPDTVSSSDSPFSRTF